MTGKFTKELVLTPEVVEVIENLMDFRNTEIEEWDNDSFLWLLRRISRRSHACHDIKICYTDEVRINI